MSPPYSRTQKHCSLYQNILQIQVHYERITFVLCAPQEILRDTYPITMNMDRKSGPPVRVPFFSCLSYNERINWLTIISLDSPCPQERLLAILLL